MALTFPGQRVRTRALTQPGGKNKIEGIHTLTPVVFPGPPNITYLGGASVIGRETTIDALHPGFFSHRKLSSEVSDNFYHFPYFFKLLNTGGPFESTKVTFTVPGTYVSAKAYAGGNNYTYQGMVSPVSPQRVLEFPKPSSYDSLRELGRRAIGITKPGQSMAEMAQLIAELRREGLPSRYATTILKDFSLRGGAGEFLNHTFGWEPIAREVYNLARNITKTSESWRSYATRANKLQRRHFEFPVETSTVSEALSNFSYGQAYPVSPPQLAVGWSSPLLRQRTITVSRRFSAAFLYLVPKGDSKTEKLASKALELEHKYGLRVDPALLWELSPWSWLVDWFVPFGSFIEALSDQFLGNTAMPWAFISEHYQVTDTYTRPGASLRGQSVGTLQVVYDYKVRLPASPFGFDLDFPDLSGKQIAILAALGLSR